VIGASEERNFQYQRIGALPPFIIWQNENAL
jgi:hypothetical protein